MSDQPQKIHRNGNPTHGYYAISPNGDLVVSPATAPLKHGWRLATEDDLDAKRAAALALAAADRRASPVPEQSPESAAIVSALHGVEIRLIELTNAVETGLRDLLAAIMPSSLKPQTNAVTDDRPAGIPTY